MEFGLNTFITFAGVLIGAGIAWGALKAWVKTNTAKVNKIEKSLAAFHGTTTENPGAQPMYIRRSECDKKSGEIQDAVGNLADTVFDQGSSIDRLVNHARWQLTTKENMSLSEANEILENGK